MINALCHHNQNSSLLVTAMTSRQIMYARASENHGALNWTTKTEATSSQPPSLRERIKKKKKKKPFRSIVLFLQIRPPATAMRAFRWVAMADGAAHSRLGSELRVHAGSHFPALFVAPTHQQIKKPSFATVSAAVAALSAVVVSSMTTHRPPAASTWFFFPLARPTRKLWTLPTLSH